MTENVCDECGKETKTARGLKCHKTRIHQESKYKNREWLKEQYDLGKTSGDISKECGCDRETIRRWARRFGIGRSLSEATKLNYERYDSIKLNERTVFPFFFTRKDNGYELACCGVNKEQVRIHRLVAVAEYGFEDVAGNVVHHKNNLPWDNRPENLQVMSRAQHTKHHHESEIGGFND